MTDFGGDVVRVDAGTTVVVNSLMSVTPIADFTHDYNFASVLEGKVDSGQFSRIRSRAHGVLTDEGGGRANPLSSMDDPS